LDFEVIPDKNPNNSKNLSSPTFILLSIVVVSFISLKNIFAFCNENSKSFPEKLYG
jgi:hypothetical protein